MPASSLSLVGPGRAGCAFARSWIVAGGTLRQIVARKRASAEEAVRRLGQGSPAALETAGGQCDFLLISVPDDAVAEVAKTLAKRVLCRAAFHISGALSSDLLHPLREAGAAVGSIHPLRPFHGDPRETWRGALVAIEGDPKAVEEGERLIAFIGARARRFESADKPLYHAAATLAAGGTVALLSIAARIWGRLGIPEEEARKALAELSQSAAGPLGERGFEETFTGPVARRDLETVRAHREALGRMRDGDLLSLYSSLAEETLSRTPGRGREKEIRALLAGNPETGGNS